MMVMNRKILTCMLAIGVVSMLFGAGTFAVFSDKETSVGNTFTAGTWGLKTSSLNPNYGYDTTGSPYTLIETDRTKLVTSDNDRYECKYDWESGWGGNYIEFKFPSIPDGITVTKVELKFEWQWESDINQARLQFFMDGGSTWPYDMYVSLLSAGTDRTETIDLKTDYGIDTVAEVNNLVIRFQAKSKGQSSGKTWHDWVQVDVEWQ